MAGVLQFTLGLEVSKALSALNVSATAVTALTATFKGLGAVVGRVWDQLDKGASLSDLSKRTGVSVANLFQLQKGFEAVGISADSVGSALFMLNKSLGGVNELGEDTKSIFAQAGLSVEELKKAGAGGAMQSVLGRMAGMDQTSASAFAGKIFGRGMAADMVQASRQMKDFNDAMAGARAQAQVFQRVAALFDTIDKAVGRAKQKLDPLFLTIAEKIAPAIEQVLNWINNIDLTPLSDAIGDAFDVLAEAFAQGKVLELLSKGFSAAIEYLGNMLFGLLGDGGFWAAIWNRMVGEFYIAIAVIAKSFLNLGVILKAAIGQAFDVLFEWVGKIPRLGKALGLKGYKAGDFGARFADEKENASGANKMLDELFGAGTSRYGKYVSGMAQAFGRAQAQSGGPAQEAFKELAAGLLGQRKGRKAASSGQAESAGERLSLDTGKGGGQRPQVTDLERIGFVFGGGMGRGAAETTAKNTTTLVALGKAQLEAMRGRGGVMTNASATA
ncbi:MAG TPA: hypothetical protein P5205_17690 [Candidatus Paceibacterota bacterium]|nr:hypothetical protein [Verrucomicrobiota bacterium]HSA12197.1 hypothetical protein [Candidatus Paceibacterota bacterium]